MQLETLIQLVRELSEKSSNRSTWRPKDRDRRVNVPKRWQEPLDDHVPTDKTKQTRLTEGPPNIGTTPDPLLPTLHNDN